MPHELPALHSPTQYPCLHIYTHTQHTHKNRQTHYNPSECFDETGNQTASHWFVQRKHDRRKLKWKQLSLTLCGFFLKRGTSKYSLSISCVRCLPVGEDVNGCVCCVLVRLGQTEGSACWLVSARNAQCTTHKPHPTALHQGSDTQGHT